MKSEPPYLYVHDNPINHVDPSGLIPPLPPPRPGGDPEQDLWALVEAARSVYSKQGLVVNCRKQKDDGQHPSDTVGDIFVDFVCEYGPNPRVFREYDRLTQELKKTHVVSEIRDEFYNSPPWQQGVEGGKRFVTAFFWATVDKVMQGTSITHFLGGFSYKVRLVGSEVKFRIENNTNRQSGTRLIPGSGAGDSIEAALDRGESASEIFEKLVRGEIVSILTLKTREETNDLRNEGGGNFRQRFEWDEPFDECRFINRNPWTIIPGYPHFAPLYPHGGPWIMTE